MTQFHCTFRFNNRKHAHMFASWVRVSTRAERHHVVRNERQGSDNRNELSVEFNLKPPDSDANSSNRRCTGSDEQGNQEHRHGHECQRHASGRTQVTSSNFRHLCPHKSSLETWICMLSLSQKHRHTQRQTQTGKDDTKTQKLKVKPEKRRDSNESEIV